MFKNRKKLTVFISSIALAISALVASTPAQAAQEVGGMTGQTAADTASGSQGGWSNTTAQVVGRPYVTALSVDGVSKLTSTPTGPTDDLWNSGLRVVVSATNSCKVGQAQAPGVCYLNPNRIGITVGYGNQDSISTNFGHSSASSYGITENSEIDMTINLNTLAPKLGWTWLNGLPSYWKVDPIAKTVRIKFKPRYMPSSNGIDNFCSTIPVSTCTTETATSEMLQASMVVSVDNTAALFAGALFASSGAIIGSLEVPSSFSITNLASNSLTYGIAAPHNFAADFTPAGASTPGGVRKGSFYGFVPNALLSSGFGLTDPTQASSLMTIARTSSTTATGTDTVTWASWDEATNGTAGQFVSITDITFSAPKFQMKRKAATSVSVAKGKSRTNKAILADVGVKLTKGQKASIAIKSSSKTVCTLSGTNVVAKKKGKCSYTVTVKNNKGKKVSTKTGFFTVR
jgi:hypothetical protein